MFIDSEVSVFQGNLLPLSSRGFKSHKHKFPGTPACRIVIYSGCDINSAPCRSSLLLRTLTKMKIRFFFTFFPSLAFLLFSSVLCFLKCSLLFSIIWQLDIYQNALVGEVRASLIGVTDRHAICFCICMQFNNCKKG